MDIKLKQTLAEQIRDFHLPRYEELPNTGLYLNQAVQYINSCLQQLGDIAITGSMIRNYVKQGLITNPIQKLYYADQIGYLICITILKHAASLECIHQLFFRQKEIYTNETAYNYFCMELENILYERFGLKQGIDDVGVTSSIEKEMLRSAIIAVSHHIYLNACFCILKNEE